MAAASRASDASKSGGDKPDTARAGLTTPEGVVERVMNARRERPHVASAHAANAEPDVEGPSPAVGERRYSFNALLTIGLAGFVLGRLCSR